MIIVAGISLLVGCEIRILEDGEYINLIYKKCETTLFLNKILLSSEAEGVSRTQHLAS